MYVHIDIHTYIYTYIYVCIYICILYYIHINQFQSDAFVARRNPSSVGPPGTWVPWLPPATFNRRVWWLLRVPSTRGKNRQLDMRLEIRYGIRLDIRYWILIIMVNMNKIQRI